MLLTGNFIRTLDEKQRFAIPRRLRDAVGFPQTNVAFLAPGTDGSLALYTESAFQILANQLRNESPTQADVRAFGRLFYAQAQRVEIDRQGRVRIPPELVALGRLKKDVVLLGVGDHLEIWDRETWEVYLSEKQSHYDEIAEAAFTDGRPLPNASTEPCNTSDVPDTPAQPR